ncbi:uncharacterized protein LOC124676868 isoform X1 [Lolium rigidum]|uniref:uncharacterized protein LOC124674532 isoform X1 n=1 Tax=Lolium rigidum TaxID=89674 RepID=UPI001F5DB4C2|nr:uncharacterized protein LOC124674532 isoform X1 [Lolium rigidum]XP_047068845.1 uncharacterized protein LOC124676868 isoform X1 [Lolium rigidum]
MLRVAIPAVLVHSAGAPETVQVARLLLPVSTTTCCTMALLRPSEGGEHEDEHKQLAQRQVECLKKGLGHADIFHYMQREMTNLGCTVWIKEWLELGKGGTTLIPR